MTAKQQKTTEEERAENSGKDMTDESVSEKGREEEKETKDEASVTENGAAREKEATEDDLKARLQMEKDRSLRLSADLENYKKRSEKEIKEFKKFANEALFKRLLTVVDNLERAISSSEAATEEGIDGKRLLEGVKMTYKDLLELFESFNVKPIHAEGELFDPAFHQAVTQEETDAYPENTVVRELQKGYIFNDRLIRPSMVVVSKKKQDKE